MNQLKFSQVYNESRNGANYFVRHPLVRRFQFSDGVQDLCALGCYWLLDILATELKIPEGEMCLVKVAVSNQKAKIEGRLSDDGAADYNKKIDYTDMPTGEWVFYITNEGERVAMILPSEY